MPTLDPEQRRAQHAAWREKNREHLRAYARARYQNNPRRREQVAAQNKKWAAEHPELRREIARKCQEKNGLKYRVAKYGITVEQYTAMLNAQDGHCAICPETESLCVDHDHETGKVRGLLCRTCNRHLGIVEKNQFGERALKYLATTGA